MGARGGGARAAVEVLGGAQVEQHGLPVGAYLDVGALEVLVDDALGMGVVEGLSQRSEPGEKRSR